MRNKIDKLREEIDKYLPQAPDIKQKILVIDDDYRNLRSFKGLFRKKALVFTAENLEEALYHMRNNKIDIVFCDYKMPKMKGDDVLKEIVKEFPNVNRVVITGYYTPEIREDFRVKSNTTDFILKPYSFEQLVDRIYNVA